MAAWFCAPDTAALLVLVVLVALVDLVASVDSVALTSYTKTGSWFYQEPVLIAISGFETLAISCSSF